MASELKPCPFCGAVPNLVRPLGEWLGNEKPPYYGPEKFRYSCSASECMAMTIAHDTEEEARQQWNTRPTPVAPVSPDAPGAARDVLAERRRQVSAEGWTPEHDDKHSSGQLAYAASVYALCAASSDADRSVMDEFRTYNSVPFRIRNKWPWDESWLKPTNRRRDLVKAAALILAEIERLDRKASEGGSNV
ncbi:Lar family restriction alleviation protein [Brucella intermedia]|uniref:Lar family restriction alleviation protein n=1 Tax=Brucella intermedia TaxID=94625 RepID=UPI00224A526A|nr:Lar family restriction alleviation protein [Brucella intermedia]